MPQMEIKLDGDHAWDGLFDTDRCEAFAPEVLHVASLQPGMTSGNRNCAFLVVREDGSAVVIETTAALVIALGKALEGRIAYEAEKATKAPVN